VVEHVAASAEPVSRRQFEWIKSQGIDTVLTLTEYPVNPELVAGLGLTIKHLPLNNHMRPPDESLREAVAFLERCVNEGSNVLVHCAAGKGRTGMVLASYLVMDYDMKPRDAIETIRRKRPGSIEKVQEEAVLGLGRPSQAGS